MLCRIFLAVAVIAVPATSQKLKRTVPDGYATRWGNNTFYHWAGARTMQVVDNSNTKPMPGIRQLAFRRRNTTYSSATGGSATMTVTMAQANWNLLDTVFDNNYHANKTEVLSKKTINIPAWTSAPPNQNFDFVIKFDKPWNYLGAAVAQAQALVWTVRYSGSTAGTHQMGRIFGGYTYAVASSVGSGCSGYSQYLRVWNTGSYHASSGIHFQVGGTGGPKSAPTLMFLDLKDSNLTIPGLCSKLHALPVVTWALGSTDASGVLSHKYVTIPWLAAAQSLTIFTQLLSLDTTQPGLPFSVSDARTTQIPSRSTTTGEPACYLWATGVSATTATGNYLFFSGAPLAEVSQ